MGISRWPVMRKAFPCYDVIMGALHHQREGDFIFFYVAELQHWYLYLLNHMNELNRLKWRLVQGIIYLTEINILPAYIQK